MPRPGPRPYECVRRAWHSDRHQPTRGSLIQQIFRLVKESHNPTTTKKKEWQEKLPFVVLKAEEIMYSKANSEAEYMNLDTLWDRLNDAVNTIIRRDESTEAGELLPPCVEAALNLGCIPVRASRSQRHCLPRSYLPRVQEHGSLPPKVVDDERCPQFSPVHSYCPMNNYASATNNNANSARPISEANAHMTESCNRSASRNYPYPYENVSSGHNQLMTIEPNTPINLGSVYPLCYRSRVLNKDAQLGLAEKVNSNTIYVGTPISTSVPEPSEKGVLQNFFANPEGIEISSTTIQRSDLRNLCEKNECDLNLRLGRSLAPCIRVGQGLAYEPEDVVSVSSQDGGKFSDVSTLKKCREFSFFTGKVVGEPSDSNSTKWFLEAESQNLKRKSPYNDNLNDGQLFWKSKAPSSQFVGHFKGPGL